MGGWASNSTLDGYKNFLEDPGAVPVISGSILVCPERDILEGSLQANPRRLRGQGTTKGPSQPAVGGLRGKPGSLNPRSNPSCMGESPLPHQVNGPPLVHQYKGSKSTPRPPSQPPFYHVSRLSPGLDQFQSGTSLGYLYPSSSL